jgi:hypothetical protein
LLEFLFNFKIFSRDLFSLFLELADATATTASPSILSRYPNLIQLDIYYDLFVEFIREFLGSPRADLGFFRHQREIAILLVKIQVRQTVTFQQE